MVLKSRGRSPRRPIPRRSDELWFPKRAPLDVTKLNAGQEAYEKRFKAIPATVPPIESELVAAGEGALSTLMAN
jgi:hypothetical protein